MRGRLRTSEAAAEAYQLIGGGAASCPAASGGEAESAGGSEPAPSEKLATPWWLCACVLQDGWLVCTQLCQTACFEMGTVLGAVVECCKLRSVCRTVYLGRRVELLLTLSVAVCFKATLWRSAGLVVAKLGSPKARGAAIKPLRPLTGQCTAIDRSAHSTRYSRPLGQSVPTPSCTIAKRCCSPVLELEWRGKQALARTLHNMAPDTIVLCARRASRGL